MTRESLLQKAENLIRQQIIQLETDLSALQIAMGEDSKSSAGDKYETSREMSQQEIEKLAKQLGEKRKSLNTCHQFGQTDVVSCISAGSLVKTSESTLLIGLPIGKIQFDDATVVYGVGASAPFVQLLHGKSAGESVSFQGRTIHIISVG